MQVGKWLKNVDDQRILEMIFADKISDYVCPHCELKHNTPMEQETVECKCGETFYVPIYAPELDT